MSTNDGGSLDGAAPRSALSAASRSTRWGRRALVTSVPASSSGSNGSEIEESQGLEIGAIFRTALTWTWSLDAPNPDIRFPFGWEIYARRDRPALDGRAGLWIHAQTQCANRGQRRLCGRPELGRQPAPGAGETIRIPTWATPSPSSRSNLRRRRWAAAASPGTIGLVHAAGGSWASITSATRSRDLAGNTASATWR